MPPKARFAKCAKSFISDEAIKINNEDYEEGMSSELIPKKCKGKGRSSAKVSIES